MKNENTQKEDIKSDHDPMSVRLDFQRNERV